jgi:hypothetical protein
MDPGPRRFSGTKVVSRHKHRVHRADGSTRDCFELSDTGLSQSFPTTDLVSAFRASTGQHQADPFSFQVRQTATFLVLKSDRHY